MAFDREQLKVTWVFGIADSDEIALTSCSITGAAFDAVAALSAADARNSGLICNGLMDTALSTAGVRWGDYSSGVAVKMAALDVNGIYLTDPVIFTDSSPDAGTVAQVIPQASIVLSFRSGTALGEANYGRMYLPHCQLELATGEASANTAVTSSVVSGLATFANAVNAEFNQGAEPGRLAIMSRVGAGTTKPVTRIAVGSITDTQRRRRNKLPEVYSFNTLTP